MLGEASKYIVDGLQLDLLLLNGEPVGVDLPPSVVMRVKDVEMSGRHWRATMEGPARLETGLVVEVPPSFPQAIESASIRRMGNI